MNLAYRVSLCCLLCALVVPVLAEEETPPLTKSTLVEDIVYGHKDGLALTLDVCTPVENAKGIGVVLVSSGGWKSGKSDVPGEDAGRREREHWVQGLLQGGYTLFIVRHGSTPRYLVNEMVDDVRRSVRFVRLNADRYQVDGERLGITSGSSGGHLSLMVGLTGDDGNPKSSDPVERVSSRTQAVVAWFRPRT
jgi:acetyl esterase/lipase